MDNNKEVTKLRNGISYCNNTNRFLVNIISETLTKSFGSFNTIEEARVEYNKALSSFIRGEYDTQEGEV